MWAFVHLGWLATLWGPKALALPQRTFGTLCRVHRTRLLRPPQLHQPQFLTAQLLTASAVAR